jgi:hypothetical protein
MKYTVPVVLTVTGYVIIDALSLSDAKASAKILNEDGVHLAEIEDPSFESECMLDEICPVMTHY